MATGKKIKTEESELKRQKKFNENREKDLRAKESLVKQIQEESREQLLPTLQEKSTELTNYIVNLLKDKGEDKINNTQILSLIARKSLNEIAMNTCQISYTPQEIMIGFNLYLDMINKINEIKKFPATPENFSLFMGVSYECYKLWLVDPNKKEVMDYINSYMLGTLSAGGLTGELKEITAMYQQKVLGKVEQNQPIVIEHKKETNIDEIQNQLSALKRDKIIEGEWAERDVSSNN
ncbi:MAG: hypothetical protein V8Q75_03440 [Bacilli bacterium]